MLTASPSVPTSRSRSMLVALCPCADSRSLNVRCTKELREKSAGSLATIVVGMMRVLLTYFSERGSRWLVTMFTSKLWFRARVRSRLKSDDPLCTHRKKQHFCKIFQAIASRQKMKEKEVFFLFITQIMEFILSSKMKCLKSVFFTNNYSVRWFDQSISEWNSYYLQCKKFQLVDSTLFCQVRWGAFSGAVEKFFGQRCLSLTYKKLPRIPMVP